MSKAWDAFHAALASNLRLRATLRLNLKCPMNPDFSQADDRG
jgi:hypothetical protein